MWLELTDRHTNQAVWVNSDLVTHVIELPEDAAPGCRLFFSNSVELAVREGFERISEYLQLS